MCIRDSYYAKRKALQDIQLDPSTAKDEELRKELIRRKHALEREAKKKGVISESIIRSIIDEAPIEMDPQNPNDPMVMPPGLNPGKLSYRKQRAAAQLADLARMAAQANEKNSAIMWDTIVKHFPELETNIRSIQHGQEELEKVRRKGGVRSRGIDPL